MKGLFLAALALLPFGRLLNLSLFEGGGKMASLSVLDLLLAVLTLVYVGRWMVRRQKPFVGQGMAGAIGLFAGWALVSLLFNAHFYELQPREAFFSGLYLMRWVHYAAFFFLACSYLEGPKDAGLLVRWLLWGAVAFTLFGVLQAVFLPDFALHLHPEARPYVDYDPQGHRLVSTFLDPNIAAGYIVFFCLIALSFYMHGFEGCLWIVLLLLLGLLLTLSRGGLAGLLIGGGLLVFGSRAVVRARLASLAALGAALVAGVYLALAPKLEEYQRIAVTDESALMRVRDWLAALEMAKENLISGIGFNTFGFVSWRFGLEREGGLAFAVAGDILLILVLTGIVGLLFYLRIYRQVFRALAGLKQSPRSWDVAYASGVRAATLAALVSSSFSTVVLYPQIMAVLWTSWAIVFRRLAEIEAVRGTGDLREPEPRVP
jgi:hypothetical protein